ncbi:MAG: PorT family protein [Bacteroidetes bacterium]|nr:PorT family protein [Bacteroidota bacterium]MBS1629656.1 PorT family protein [Bacteroidota bacterium]
MKKIIIASMAALLSAGFASAQVGIAPELGLNLASISGKGGGNSMNSGMLPGARIGGMVELGLTKNIYLRPGLQFSMMGGKGGDLKVLNNDLTMSINYILIPINVLYKLGKAGDGRFYAGLEPYLGFALGGKYKVSGSTTDLKIGGDAGKDDVKPLDFGAGVKVGYELPMGLYFDVAYLLGITNNLPGGNSDNKMSNRNISIGVGYFILHKGDKK